MENGEWSQSHPVQPGPTNQPYSPQQYRQYRSERSSIQYPQYPICCHPPPPSLVLFSSPCHATRAFTAGGLNSMSDAMQALNFFAKSLISTSPPPSTAKFAIDSHLTIPTCRSDARRTSPLSNSNQHNRYHPSDVNDQVQVHRGPLVIRMLDVHSHSNSCPAAGTVFIPLRGCKLSTGLVRIVSTSTGRRSL